MTEIHWNTLKIQKPKFIMLFKSRESERKSDNQSPIPYVQTGNERESGTYLAFNLFSDKQFQGKQTELGMRSRSEDKAMKTKLTGTFTEEASHLYHLNTGPFPITKQGTTQTLVTS